MKARTILIVEDEMLIAVDLKNRFEGRGYSVLPVAGTCRAAVASALKNRPDLIIMDVVLKGDGTGVDAACAIVRQYAVPILFLTGNANMLENGSLRTTVPVFKVLSKPPADTLLMNAVEGLLEGA
jgi:two-component system, response regulator PdtaR